MKHRLRVMGIDPSLNNTAVAVVTDKPTAPLECTVETLHINALMPGDYSNAIRKFHTINDPVTCGFVEDFSNIGGGDTNKNAIKSVSHSGGMAEEAIVAAGIPMMPIDIRKWRKVVLGVAPVTRTKSGKEKRYWTKGEKKFGVPNNLTAALLAIFNDSLCLHAKANYKQLPDCLSLESWEWEDILEAIPNMNPTTRRIQLIFGYSLDELEAAAIALAGFRLWRAGKIEALQSQMKKEDADDEPNLFESD